MVNGARTLNGTCHNKDYSSGSAAQDYFITGASIHILNGEVSLSYYNNGSSTTYQKMRKGKKFLHTLKGEGGMRKKQKQKREYI